MKKLIAIALAGVLALSMAACGAQSTETTATAAAAATAAAETAAEAAKLSGTVTLAGSTSMQKLCEAMIESFEESYPDITVTAEYTGSGAGLESLVGGKTDIGNASRALKDGEKDSGAVENIVAIDGIAVITHTSNTVSNLTSQQLTDIYTGKITNWVDLGGADEAIVVLGREAVPALAALSKSCWMWLTSVPMPRSWIPPAASWPRLLPPPAPSAMCPWMWLTAP